MLDVFDSSAAQFEQGRNAGREEERNRVIRTFHEEVSSSIIAALFLIETVKSELEDAGLPQAEAISKASECRTTPNSESYFLSCRGLSTYFTVT